MMVIDSDRHLHEPFDLFERYIEKEFYAMRPRIVDLCDEPRDTGRWLAEDGSCRAYHLRRRRISLPNAAPRPDESGRRFPR